MRLVNVAARLTQQNNRWADAGIPTIQFIAKHFGCDEQELRGHLSRDRVAELHSVLQQALWALEAEIMEPTCELRLCETEVGS